MPPASAAVGPARRGLRNCLLMSRRQRPEHPFVRDLRRALAADAQADVELALEVAVLLARGSDRADVEAITGASRDDVRRACERLGRVAPELAARVAPSPRARARRPTAPSDAMLCAAMRFQRELDAARVAVRTARSSVQALRPRDLDDEQKRTRRRILDALREATGGGLGVFEEDPIIGAWTGIRRALSDIDKLGRGLDDERREILSGATTALHEAEDVLAEPVSRGGARGY